MADLRAALAHAHATLRILWLAPRTRHRAWRAYGGRQTAANMTRGARHIERVALAASKRRRSMSSWTFVRWTDISSIGIDDIK